MMMIMRWCNVQNNMYSGDVYASSSTKLLASTTLGNVPITLAKIFYHNRYMNGALINVKYCQVSDGQSMCYNVTFHISVAHLIYLETLTSRIIQSIHSPHVALHKLEMS